jgi:DNA-3-methyladenine glycosylase
MDAESLARDLLGRYLVRTWPAGPRSGKPSRAVLKITETEAYLGHPDRASHAFAGRRTPRNESLYLPGGHWYVYFIYGMYYCLNVVAGESDNGEAVLIRAGVAVENAPRLETNRRQAMGRRKSARPDGRAIDLAGGPGKLCQALGIGREFDGLPCHDARLYLATGEPVSAESDITRSPRIGIDYAAEARDWPLRFRLGQV